MKLPREDSMAIYPRPPRPLPEERLEPPPLLLPPLLPPPERLLPPLLLGELLRSGLGLKERLLLSLLLLRLGRRSLSPELRCGRSLR